MVQKSANCPWNVLARGGHETEHRRIALSVARKSLVPISAHGLEALELLANTRSVMSHSRLLIVSASTAIDGAEVTAELVSVDRERRSVDGPSRAMALTLFASLLASCHRS